MRQTRNTPSAVTLAPPAPATITPRKRATPPATKPAPALKPLRRPTIKSSLSAPTNALMAQLVNDMAVAGLAESTQRAYLEAVQRFIQATWVAPAAASEADLQSYLIDLRRRDVAGETFRVQRFALQFLFQNTLGRDWPIFKKN
jgi:hypothetical protein